MSRGEVVRVDDVTHRRSRRFGYRQVFLTGIATLVAALPGSILIASQPAFAAGNANLIGTWKISGGYLGITIKSENRTTGACAGMTANSQYHLIGCHVTGSKYVFTITQGASYRSHNVGRISGNRIIGSFKDTNGTVAQYTGVR